MNKNVFFFTVIVQILNIPFSLLSQGVNEYTVKGLYLYNFTRLVQWPDISEKDNFTIGVYNNATAYDYLSSNFSGKLADGIPIKISDIATPEEAVDCQIVFIPISSKDEEPIISFIRKINFKNKLIITDYKLETTGAHIGFFAHKNKLTYNFNPVLIENSGLKMSPKFLSLGKAM